MIRKWWEGKSSFRKKVKNLSLYIKTARLENVTGKFLCSYEPFKYDSLRKDIKIWRNRHWSSVGNDVNYSFLAVI